MRQSIFRLNCLCITILTRFIARDQTTFAEYDRLISEQSLRPSDDLNITPFDNISSFCFAVHFVIEKSEAEVQHFK